MVVLGIAVVVTTLGVSFIEANSTAMPEAMNRVAAARARYLAESGVDVATHFLLYPPTTVTVGNYWTGALGIAIDATNDYVDVAVGQDAVDANIFDIKVSGASHDFDGNVSGRHNIVARVLVPDPPKWKIPYAYLGTSWTDLWGLEVITGDMHVNGDLYSGGECGGNVSATGMVAWFSRRKVQPASINQFAPAYTPPIVDPALWVSYEIAGKKYAATVLKGPVLTIKDAKSLNQLDMSATNPGRLFLAPKGDFFLDPKVMLAGTLVVTGNLFLGNAATITATPNFPALVVTGDVILTTKGANIAIDGSLLCGGLIDDQSINAGKVAMTGATVTRGLGLLATKGKYRFVWDARLASFWNFEPGATRDPITILDWKEN